MALAFVRDICFIKKSHLRKIGELKVYMDTLSDAIRKLTNRVRRCKDDEREKRLRLEQQLGWLKELQLRRIKDKVEMKRKRAALGQTKA